MITQPSGAYISKENENLPKVQPPVAKIDEIQAAAESSESSLQNGASSKQFTPPKMDVPLRLAIERDSDSGDWVYKSIDRLTGEVVSQFPREEILNMKRSAKYRPGSVIKTKI